MDRGKYEQLNLFDLIDKKPEQKEISYDRCDYCNLPCCYGCEYLEEEVNKNEGY